MTKRILFATDFSVSNVGVFVPRPSRSVPGNLVCANTPWWIEQGVALLRSLRSRRVDLAPVRIVAAAVGRHQRGLSTARSTESRYSSGGQRPIFATKEVVRAVFQ